jgi:hypothetical protein
MVEERRHSVIKSVSRVRLYIQSAITIAGMMITGDVLINLFIKDASRADHVTGQIRDIGMPLIVALIGAGFHGVAVSIDGRLSQLLRTTAEKERTEGFVEGLSANPDIPIKLDKNGGK